MNSRALSEPPMHGPEGTYAPYHETPFEVQRFALQQNWRLVTERLSESWKHKPAWALFLSSEHRTAALSIRGTDVEQFPDQSTSFVCLFVFCLLAFLFASFSFLPSLIRWPSP